jgi:hypothetical protein
MIQSTGHYDLLKAKPISVQIAQGHQEDVWRMIAKAVSKCDNMLGTNQDPSFLEDLAEEIIDEYKYDSVEDIIECLKKGRRGKYGKNYNKFNMIVVAEWMSRHLEEKAIEREKIIANRKKEEYEYPIVDYDAYREKLKQEPKKKKAIDKDEEYRKFKSEYYKNKILKENEKSNEN